MTTVGIVFTTGIAARSGQTSGVAPVIASAPECGADIEAYDWEELTETEEV